MVVEAPWKIEEIAARRHEILLGREVGLVEAESWVSREAA